jgi:general stress protein 26
MVTSTPEDITTNMARLERLLAAARDTMARVTYCWAATPSGDGGVNLRLVGPIRGVSGEEDWTIWFVTSGGSRKVADIRRAGRLTLGYQHHPDRAALVDYVALIGRAALGGS